MQTADALVQILRAEGVEQSFCYPFSPIMDAMARAGVKPIVTRQERVAGNMADGVSRSTNGDKMGVVTVQALAGSENAFAGIAHAHTDSTPVLFPAWASGDAFRRYGSDIRQYAQLSQRNQMVTDPARR